MASARPLPFGGHVVGPRLLGLAAILARRHGMVAVRMLVKAARTWLADPANEPARRALVDQLQRWSHAAGDRTGRVAARLAREVDRRRVSIADWERDLMRLRYEIADMAPGPMREAALDAYAAQAGASVHLVTAASRRDEAARRVLDALATEARMLRTERFTRDERRRAETAVADARAACRAATAREAAGAR